MAKIVSRLAERLDCTSAVLHETQKQRDALAAENADLKHALAVTLEHISVTDSGQAGVAAMIINDAMHHSETPATDAFLAELRAQGVEMFGKDVEESGSGNRLMRAIARRALNFAAQLRQGDAQ
ncbi:hypothetical protein AM264_03400 [Escherichia coli]|nr:hypothetical protein AM264_03400 [Escherichia coli]